MIKLFFLLFSKALLWYSYGLLLVRLLFSYGFARYSDGIPVVFFYGFPMLFPSYSFALPKTQSPRWLTKPLRKMTERPSRGSPWLTEALRRLTEAWRICTGARDNGVCGGGLRSAGSWACAGAGLLVCRCAGGVVCKCASVPAIAVVYQYAGVQMLPQISLWFPCNRPICLLSLSYDFLWMSCEFLLFVDGFLRFPISFSGCLYGFPVNLLGTSCNSR